MRLLLAAILFLLIAVNAEGQPRSFIQQLPQDTVVHVFVTLDWKSLERKKMDKAYVPATAHIGFTGGQEMNLKVKTRGHMRLGICSYPPLKLKFSKSDLSLHACSDMNEMDLVHPCHNGEAYDQFLLLEYLAYKLYRLLTPYSFETRLIRMHYLNPDKTEEHEPTYAFLVENEEELVDRLNGKSYNSSTISKNSIEHDSYLLMSLFQFMIGNTDWHMPSRHNLEFILIPGHPLLISVPFDFDYSGLVSAPYAAHHESIKLSSVEVRYYQGWCESDEAVKKQIDLFLSKKAEIMAMPAQIAGLNEKSIAHVTNYLNDFFTIIENPRKLENMVIRHCDMWPVKE